MQPSIEKSPSHSLTLTRQSSMSAIAWLRQLLFQRSSGLRENAAQTSGG
jgi:hypothetical protein